MVNKHITTVFFDWGGVVANDPGTEFLENLLRSLGAPEDKLTLFYKHYLMPLTRGKITEDQMWNDLRQQHGLTVPKDVSHHFLKWDGLKANADILNLIDEVRLHGYRTAMLSNIIAPTYRALEQADYYSHFDAVVASCYVGYAKPEPEMYKAALALVHARAEECLFVDDKQLNLDPAQRLGFVTILAENPQQIIHDVRAVLSL